MRRQLLNAWNILCDPARHYVNGLSAEKTTPDIGADSALRISAQCVTSFKQAHRRANRQGRENRLGKSRLHSHGVLLVALHENETGMGPSSCIEKKQ